MPTEEETNQRIDGPIDAVLMRFDNTVAGSAADIYVWSNGTITDEGMHTTFEVN